MALPIGDRLGLAPVLALIGHLVAGVLVGYLVSVFLVIFLSGTGSDTTENEN
jgi:hypothetical protein